jgi:hypothetical protein
LLPSPDGLHEPCFQSGRHSFVLQRGAGDDLAGPDAGCRSGRSHLLPAIPKGSKVVFSQFTPIPIPEGVSIVVYGKIGFGGEVRSIHEVFTLAEVEDRFFVVGDCLSFYRTDIGDFLPGDDLFQVTIRDHPPAEEPPADAPQPAEAKPQSSPPGKRPVSSQWFWQNPDQT